MSAVKLKNATLKAVQAAIARGELPAIAVSARLRDNRIWIDIDAAPFDVLRPENITDSGYRIVIVLGSGEDRNHTPEGIALLADVKAIGNAVCPRGLIVDFSSDCYTAQGRRQNAAKASPAIAALAGLAIAVLALASPAAAQSYDSFRSPGVLIDRDPYNDTLRIHGWGETPSRPFYGDSYSRDYRAWGSDIIIERDDYDGSLSLRRWGESAFDRFYPGD